MFEKEIDQVRNSKRKVEDLRDAENTTAKGGKGGKWITFNEEVIKKEQEIKEVQIKLTYIDNQLDSFKIKKGLVFTDMAYSFYPMKFDLLFTISYD